MNVSPPLPIAALLVAGLAGGVWWYSSIKNRNAEASPTTTAPVAAVPSPTGDKTTNPSLARTPNTSPAPTAEQGTITEGGKFEPSEQQSSPGFPSAETMQEAVSKYLRQTGSGEITIGRVKLRQGERAISFPVTLAEPERPLEYVLVHETGKTHEALFKTSVPPQDLHVAALLLRAVGQAPAISVTWRKHGGDARWDLADLIRVSADADDSTNANVDTDILARGGWNYNGSRFGHGGFAAISEGSFIALVNDPAALINHPAAGATLRDDVFYSQPGRLPPPGIEATVHLTFPQAP